MRLEGGQSLFFRATPSSPLSSADLSSRAKNQIVSLSFGGTLYPFDSADLMRGLYTAGGSECIGAITGLDLGSGAPMGWIIGAAWLKNVGPPRVPSPLASWT